MNGTDAAARSRAQALARIAAVFGLSADAFVQVSRSGQRAPERLAAAMEAAALQDAFARIADPGTRRRCLVAVEAAARAEALESGAAG
ncbi:hypothetical protein Q8W71_17285 [Methylobacterium sp. NEAU 140]|uniref:hypothetical protein n=1 Tax=Methylobacterium sp. NEAU 140 TaxID=3064945 RepID=UPI0027354454|nr:hypothetical protein [Methylobacterium sp. NEAU 140]MDP4024382.1 hypothetical protein [Methylobacterium sp. NEAU 140]